MNPVDLEQLARQFLDHALSREEFLESCLDLTAAKTHDATIDVDRRRRCGFPEVIFAEGKTTDSLVEIFRELTLRQIAPLATRVSHQQAERLKSEFDVIHNMAAKTVRGRCEPDEDSVRPTGRVAIVAAGTSDVPIAEEARETLAWMQVASESITDVGVAGPHRLTAHLGRLRTCDAIIVVAGMEGALPSVVGGHVACPVIAVPTSVGYGAAFGGVAALLGMLNSCAANVAVVNIDGGFKAAYVAGLIAHRQAPHNPAEQDDG